jgi:hypothetical protein
MTPYLVTPPAAQPVPMSELKAHLNVTFTDDDGKIAGIQEGAVAMLDGYTGILGRAIMPQTWAVDVIGPGPHLLPMPDATSVAATVGADPLAVEVSRTAKGSSVSVPDAATNDVVKIAAVYGLPATLLPGAKTIIKLMAKREYDALSGAEYDASTRTIQAQIHALRWGRL